MGLKGIFLKAFPPIEVRATKDIVAAFLDDNASLSYDLVRKSVFKLIDDTERTVYTIRCEHKTPDYLALMLISNVAAALLENGQHHIYRGTLGMVGGDIRNVFNLAVKAMHEKGYCSEEEAKKDLEWIRRRIQEAG